MKPRRTVSFDANAAAPVLPQAWDAYVEATRTGPSPKGLEAARAEVAAFIGAEADEIFFTSGGTESDAWALMGAVDAMHRDEADAMHRDEADAMHRDEADAPHAAASSRVPHVVTSRIEHAAVQQTLAMLAIRGQVTLTQVPLSRRGSPEVQDVVAHLRPHTKLVSWLAASNETGVVQPIEAIAKICRARGIVMHTDAVQAVGKMPVDVRALDVDLLSFSGHKLGSVGGIGVLYRRRGTALGTTHAGASPELANTPGAMSLAAAVRHAPTDAERSRVQALRDHFEATLRAAHPAMEVIGEGAPRLYNTSCIRFPGVQGDGLLMALDIAGFAVSTGSACSSGSIEPSPVLLGMGLAPIEALEGLRVSMHRDTQAADVDALLAQLAHALAICRPR